jgi:hypothetical protein
MRFPTAAAITLVSLFACVVVQFRDSAIANCQTQATRQEEPLSTDFALKSILDEINLVPPVRPKLTSDTNTAPAKLPAFAPKVLDALKPDGDKSIDELRKRHQSDREKFAQAYPLQTVVFDAINSLQASDKMVVRDTLKAPITPKLKAELMQTQGKAGQVMFELERAHQAMTKAAENDLLMDRSRRWRAHFDLVEARLMARIALLYEHSFLLGQIRLDALPELMGGADSWQLVSRDKMQVPELRAKQRAKQAAKAWRDIQKNYPDTPWAYFAQHDSTVALGLEWQVKKQ